MKITADDIKKLLKIEGKEVGELLKCCQRYVWKYPDKNTKEDLIKLIGGPSKNGRK